MFRAWAVEILRYGLKSLAELDEVEEKEREDKEVRQSEPVLPTTPGSSLDDPLLFFNPSVDLALE